MSRKCELSGKKPMFGNNISHSHRKTRRKWVPNLQKKTFVSENGEKITLQIGRASCRERVSSPV